MQWLSILPVLPGDMDRELGCCCFSVAKQETVPSSKPKLTAKPKLKILGEKVAGR